MSDASLSGQDCDEKTLAMTIGWWAWDGVNMEEIIDHTGWELDWFTMMAQPIQNVFGQHFGIGLKNMFD